MKRFLAAAFFGLASSLISVNALAQVLPTNNPPNPPTGPTNGIDMRLPTAPDLPQLYGSSNRPSVPREARVLKKGLLAPSAEDRLAAAALLRISNTGLIRLQPREKYGRIKQSGKMVMSDGGAYYSFTYISHYYGFGSDIALERNNLSVGFAGADYGMLTNLGDVPLESISRKDARATFLSSYEPPSEEQKARAEYRRFGIRGGVTIDGAVYSSRIPVQENATYLLRSIVYDRSDVLVALRVTRKDTDGSVIIAWKLLKSYGTPVLFRNR